MCAANMSSRNYEPLFFFKSKYFQTQSIEMCLWCKLFKKKESNLVCSVCSFSRTYKDLHKFSLLLFCLGLSFTVMSVF